MSILSIYNLFLPVVPVLEVESGTCVGARGMEGGGSRPRVTCCCWRPLTGAQSPASGRHDNTGVGAQRCNGTRAGGHSNYIHYICLPLGSGLASDSRVSGLRLEMLSIGGKKHSRVKVMGNRQATKMTDMNNLVMSTDKKGQKRHCGSACLRVEEGSQWPVTSVYNVSDSGSRRGPGDQGR